jgi:hypothetical protein
MMLKINAFALMQIVCSLLLCVSCKDNTQGNVTLYPVYDEEKVVVNIGVSSGTIDINEVLDSVEFVHLETSDECLLGEIDKIICQGDKYYILDRTKTKRLLRFDSAGRFEKHFGRTGQGPGEYIEPTDFIVTSSNVIILDQFAHKLLFFNMEGDYTRSLSLKYKIHAITSLSGDSLFIAKAGDNRHTDVEDYELLVMDANGEVKFKGIENEFQMKYSLSGYYSQKMNGRVIYCKPMSKIIYEVTDTCIKERYHLNILNSPLPENYEELCDGQYEMFMKNYKGKYNYFSGQFIETEKSLFCTVVNTDNQLIPIIYDKYTKEIKSGRWVVHGRGNQIGLTAFVPLSISHYMTVNGNNIVGYIDSSYIPDKGDSNPILVLFQIRE